MIFIWRWPFFVRTLEERLAKLAKAQASFEYHAALSRDIHAAKAARIARLVAQNEIHGAEAEEADRVAENFRAIRTKRIATVEPEPTEGRPEQENV